MAAILAEKARRTGSNSFASFVKQAWHLVPQVEPLVWSWHMEALCSHAEAVARGEMHMLAVNVPPGHSKSVLWTVLWPAWVWTWWPKCQFLFGSYAHNYVVRDARRCREVIASEWYRETYAKPGGWQLREDYGAADNFSNTVGGVRFASSVGGAGAGLRAHIICVDDPLNITDAVSKAARDEAVLWISQTLSQRFVAGYPPRLVMVMQRLHAEDPTEWMKRNNAQLLILASEFDPANRCVTMRTVGTNGDRQLVEFWRDPRTEAGELLFPALYPRERINGDKLRMGSIGFAAQHQQAPVAHALAGHYFRRGWFNVVAAPPAETEVVERVRSWDLASVEGGGDWTIGVKVSKLKDGTFCIENVVRGQFGPRGVRELVKATAAADGYQCKILVPQDPGQAGKDQASQYVMMLAGYTIRTQPPTGSKEVRAGAASAQAEAKHISMVRGTWNEPFWESLEGFPDPAVHDDDVDAFAEAINSLTRKPTVAELWSRVQL